MLMYYIMSQDSSLGILASKDYIGPFCEGLIALNVQVAMALIEVNSDEELSTKRVAESWIWPRQILHNGHMTSAA
jgi:hypothetical protein